MADKVFRIEDFQSSSGSSDDSGDRFLIDEGLDLLSAYRSISDSSLRLSIKKLVEAIARSQKASVTPSLR